MLFCSQCGAQLPAEAAFCGECGEAVHRSSPAQSFVQIPSIVSDETYRLFVGEKYEYYKEKWESARQKGNKISWNWPAFFLGPIWLVYRKMFIYFWIFAGVVIAEALFEIAFDFSSKIFDKLVFWGVSILFGTLGNYWYRLHAIKKMQEIIMTNTPEQTKLELVRQGGTSMGAAIAVIGVEAVLLILMIMSIIYGDQ
jgi:hypothetical protein